MHRNNKTERYFILQSTPSHISNALNIHNLSQLWVILMNGPKYWTRNISHKYNFFGPDDFLITRTHNQYSRLTLDKICQPYYVAKLTLFTLINTKPGNYMARRPDFRTWVVINIVLRIKWENNNNEKIFLHQ